MKTFIEFYDSAKYNSWQDAEKVGRTVRTCVNSLEKLEGILNEEMIDLILDDVTDGIFAGWAYFDEDSQSMSRVVKGIDEDNLPPWPSMEDKA